MDPQLYEALTANIQSLGDTAARMTIPEGTRPTMPFSLVKAGPATLPFLATAL